MTGQHVFESIAFDLADIERLKSRISQMLVGRKVMILANWRDQPHGHSKKNRKGDICIVSEVYFENSRTCLFLEGYRYGIWLEEVTVLGDDQ